jgi:hypothetical protein
MAINLVQSSFEDIYGNVTSQFKANAGDKIKVKHLYEMEISFVSTNTNAIEINNLERKLSRTSGSFLDDGFYAGQTYALYEVNENNNIHASYTGTILSVSDSFITATNLPNINDWNSISTGHIIVLLALDTYKSIEFAFNFVDNESPTPSLGSLIDGETSKFSAINIHDLAVNTSLPLVQNGKKSGQFSVTNATIKRVTDTTNPYTAFNSTRRNYEVSFELIMPSMFSENSFIGQNCLKYYSLAQFKVIPTAYFASTKVEYNTTANTGLWNEGFNADQANSTYSLGVDSLFFNTTNTFTITATSLTSLGINSVELGAMYLTLDDDFNKNKEESQDEILPLLKTGLINATNINDSWVSTTSKEFEITLNDFSITDLGGVRTYSLEFILNPFYSNPNGFGKFIEDRGELDREFLIWLKVGNTNRLLFDSQLLFDEPVGQPFTPITANYINHDNNIDYKQVISVLNNKSNNDFNLEDDITHISEFSLFSTDVNETINAKVVVVNLSNDFEFVLDKVSFDLTDVDLQYFINQVAPLTNNLPDSSRKKEAFLYERSALSGNEMELRLFYPIVIDWRYWEEVLTTHPFFVSQNKNNSNWLNYQSLPWKVFVKIEIKRNGVIDYYYQPLDFKDYDDWSGISTIELFDATGTTQYSNMQENMTMMIKATHIFPSNYFGNPWGMITIEPKESSPRYILSTEIDRTQTENPLVGISVQQRCDIEFYSANTIILRAYVNTNLLDGSNFCISSKISEDGQENNNPELNKLTEDNQDKITEDALNIKIIE